MATKKVEVDERVIAIQTKMDNLVEDAQQVDLEQAELQALLDAKIQHIKDSFKSKFDALSNKKQYIFGELRALFEQVPQKETKTQRKVSLLSGDVVVKNATKKLDYDKKVLLERAESEITKYNATKEELENKLADIEDRIDVISKLDPLDADLDVLYVNRNELIESINELDCQWIQYVKSKEVKDFDWSAYKEKLEIIEIDDFDKETGEIKGKINQIINTDTGEIINMEGLQLVDVPEQVVIK